KMRAAVVGAALFLAAGCGTSQAFKDASAKFAAATTEGAAAYERQFTDAADLCRKRAELDFLQHRLESSPGFEWGKSPTCTERYQSRRVSEEGTDTWKQHCDRLAKADALQKRALVTLTAYATALAS